MKPNSWRVRGVVGVLFLLHTTCLWAGTLTTLYGFKGGADGEEPFPGLLVENGLLYGSTAFGGSSSAGSVFSIDPSDGTKTTVYDFGSSPDASDPASSLVFRAGALYGASHSGGAYGYGSIFRIDVKSGVETVIHSFSGADGNNPQNLIIQGATLYGTTLGGGASNDGALYAYDTDTGVETTLHSFSGPADGSSPFGLVFYSGSVYVSAQQSGATGHGSIVKVGTDGTASVLYSFNAVPDAIGPQGSAVLQGGYLYGASTEGGTKNIGAIYKIDPTTGAETVLCSFTDGKKGGKNPPSPLFYQGGALYGTTISGGPGRDGVLFSVDAVTGIKTVLGQFNGGNGSSPGNGVISFNGSFFGTTGFGGPDKTVGTVFQYTP